MVKNKKTPAALAYLAESRKKGFKYDQIKTNLQKAGYADEVIELAEIAYHHKRKNLFMTFALAALIIAFFVTSYIETRAITSTQEVVLKLQSTIQNQQQPLMGPTATQDCIGKIGVEKTQCLVAVQSTLQRIALLATADDKTKMLAELAAIDNNAEQCDTLDPESKKKCHTEMILVRSQVTNNPSVCENLDTTNEQVKCYMDTLSRTDPGAAEQIRAIIKEVETSQDKTKCNRLSNEFLIRTCKEIP